MLQNDLLSAVHGRKLKNRNRGKTDEWKTSRFELKQVTGEFMAETIDGITVNYEDESGKQLVKELDKVILTRGSWTTIVFMYQDRDRKTDQFGDPKVTIRRYKKSGNQFRQQSKFNISSKKQALQIADILTKWFAE